MKNSFARHIIGMGLVAAVVVGTASAAQADTALSAADLPIATAAQSTCPAPTQPAGGNPAQSATVSASFTAGWNNIAAVSDGTVLHTGGNQGQMWGTYSANRPSQQWLQYDWSGAASLTGASVGFWYDNASDTAGDGVAVPSSWKLQSWTGATWADVALKDGAAYPRARDITLSVTFAAPVSTTKLRAVFDAAGSGASFAAMAVSEFAVQGSAPSKAGLAVLRSDSFNIGISHNTGAIYQLGNTSDVDFCTNYVANPTTRPNFDVNDSRWVGDVLMRVNGQPRVTGLSDDIRTITSDENSVKVAYSGNAANQYGVRGFDLTETYALTGQDRDVLDWSIDVANTSATSMKIEDLGIPLLMNAWWDGGNQTGIYEQNVGRHSFVADDGSYMYWQRPNGEGPYLVMVPKDGTSLEFKDKARKGEGPFAENDPAWEGLVEYYVHSENIAPARVGQDKAAQYLPATSATLAAGQSSSYGFTFRWADDYADMRDVLFDAGVVDAVSLPGMTIPQDTAVTLAVRAKDGIDSVVGGGIAGGAGTDSQVTPAGEANGYRLYKIAFPTLGENAVTVNYGGGKKSVLQYFSIEPVENLIKANAQFIATKQQAKDPARGYDGAYLQWDMRTKQMITRDNLGSVALTGLSEFERRWMTGGSDDVGLSPAAFLAEKNSLDADAAQVASLDYYIDNFLLGYLQNQFKDGQRTWNLYHWYDGGDGERPATGNEDGTGDVGGGLATWRIMNSPHVWNTYFAMYQIATENPTMTKRPAAEYLDFAYQTLKAYFLHTDSGTWLLNSSRDMASMGELSEPLIRDALKAAGRTAEAEEIQALMHEKYTVLAAKKYPFASEMSIDTTAFEASYTLAREFGDNELARKVTAASLASRGTQPLWYFYGGDNRHMGESWWNLSYETQLGAWQQQDYLLNYDVAANGFDAAETMRSTYGAYLAGWANINSGQISSDPANYGAASWIYQSEKGQSEYAFVPNMNGWWAWSGESALGFWGGLKTAAVNVVDDSIVGTYAYGADLTSANGQYTIVPKDGVRQRLHMFNEGKFALELDGAKYTKAVIGDDLKTITLSLERSAAAGAKVTMNKLPAGVYDVAVDGTSIARTATDGRALAVALPPIAAGGAALTVTFVGAAPTAVTITGAGAVESAKSLDLTATVAPAGADGAVTWASSNSAVATVSVTGTVRGVTAGAATITATSASNGALIGSKTITVTAPTRPPLAIVAAASTRCVSGKVVLTTTVRNSAAVPVDVSITTVFGDKKIIALQPGKSASTAFTTRVATVAAGTATISATAAGGLSYERPVNYAATTCR